MVTQVQFMIALMPFGELQLLGDICLFTIETLLLFSALIGYSYSDPFRVTRGEHNRMHS